MHILRYWTQSWSEFTFNRCIAAITHDVTAFLHCNIVLYCYCFDYLTLSVSIAHCLTLQSLDEHYPILSMVQVVRAIPVLLSDHQCLKTERVYVQLFVKPKASTSVLSPNTHQATRVITTRSVLIHQIYKQLDYLFLTKMRYASTFSPSIALVVDSYTIAFAQAKYTVL